MINKSKKGFSLIEILVAIAVIGIGLLTIAGIFPLGLSQTRIMGQRVFVIQQLQAKMEYVKSMNYTTLYNLIINNQKLEENPLTDISGKQYPGYIFRAAFSDPGYNEKVLKIKVEIYWIESNAYGKSLLNKSFILEGFKGQELQ